jgi:hypothetical protein
MSTERTERINTALKAIDDLQIADVLQFFYDKASPRDHEIAGLVPTDDELECDGALISEGDNNGAFVLCWVWVDFCGTDLDKNNEDEKEEEDAD